MKRSKPIRKSAKSLKNNLWKVFSEYIRMKDANEMGYVKCISCPAVKHWKDMQAGHCIPKSLGLSIYFEEKNVKPQCPSCNIAYQGNQYRFVEALKKIYGPDIEEELKSQQSIIRQIKKWEYLELIEKYKTLVDGLNGRF